jgi:outer membrane protein TolC
MSPIAAARGWFAVFFVFFPLVGIASAQPAGPPAGDPPPMRPEKGDYEPARETLGAIGLEQAIRVALAHDPEVARARAEAEVERGRLRESSGVFDLALKLDSSYQLDPAPLSSGELDLEKGKRELLRQLSIELQRIADALRAQLDSDSLAFPDLEDPFEEIVIDGASIGEDAGFVLQGIDLSTLNAINRDFALMGAFGREDLQQELIDANHEITRQLIDALDETAFKLRRALRRFSQIPKYTDSKTLIFDLGLVQPFRNGLIVNPGVRLESRQSVYRGKGSSPIWGGKGAQDAFRTTLRLDLTFPLGRGRGSASTGAADRAARLNYRAAVSSHAHACSESALRACLAYWTVLAAQEQVEIQGRSVSKNEELLRYSEALVRSGDLAAVDLNLTRARVRESRATLEAARVALLAGRVALASAMGLWIEGDADAPLAGDAWPAVPDTSTLAGFAGAPLMDRALDRRGDRIASRLREQSGQVLARAAKADRQKRADLSFRVAYSGLDEGGDMTDAALWLDGTTEALGGPYAGPSFRLALHFELPFQNREADGRYLQARALARRGEIAATDLDRNVRSRIEELVTNLITAAQEVRIHEASARTYRELVDSQIQRFRIGESTLINVVETEQQQLTAEREFVRAKQS